MAVSSVWPRARDQLMKGDDFVKGVEAGVLTSVFNIHDGTGDEVYKLGQMLLRPAF